MTFKDYLDNVDVEEMLKFMIEHYYNNDKLSPGVEKHDIERTIKGYRHVLTELENIVPIKTGMSINITYVPEEHVEYDGDSWTNDAYYNVNGLQDGDDEAWAIEFQPWGEWLGMEVLECGLPAHEIVAHCLWEMTFMGFSDKAVREQLAEISDKVEQVKADSAIS